MGAKFSVQYEIDRRFEESVREIQRRNYRKNLERDQYLARLKEMGINLP